MPRRPPTLTPAQARREAFAAFALACALLIAAALLSLALPFVRANLAFVAALVFLFVPGFFLKRHGETDAEYGLSGADWRRGGAIAILTTLVTAAMFLPAYHLWSTRVDDRAAHFSLGNYERVGERFHGAPQAPDDGRVHVWTWGSQLIVEWSPAEGPYTLRVHSEGENTGGGLAATPAAFQAGDWVPTLTHHATTPRHQRLIFAPVNAGALEITATEAGATLDASRYVAGAAARPLSPAHDGDGVRIPLGYAWLLSVLMTQLILVAIPEEFFFRGFVQTRLHQAWGDGGLRIFGLTLTRGIVVSSLLFTISHLFIGFGLHRLLVFFPSLLFGALRHRSGGIVAPALYHAACNLMVLLASVHYF